MALAVDVVKRGGKRPTEAFTRDKLHASVKAACLSVRTPEGQSHDTADKVCDLVIIWLDDKSAVTSDDLRRQAVRVLETFHPEAAYLYQHHRMIM